MANTRRSTAFIFTLLFLGAAAGPALAQDPPSEETILFFKQNCASCHTIGGGRLTGPDLKDVATRAERDWLVEFLNDPKGVIDRGEPYGLELLSEARGQYMPTVTGMTPVLAGKLLDLIDSESALEKSRFIGLQLSDRPLTAVDVARGEELFMGSTAFMGDIPACVSCHSVGSMGSMSSFGGGQLGPDLTDVYGRLEGRKGLGAWLAAPPSAVMQPLFRLESLESEEILGLVAFLEDSAAAGEPSSGTGSLNFVLAGIALAAALMVAFDLLWRRRFRAVRRPLVARS